MAIGRIVIYDWDLWVCTRTKLVKMIILAANEREKPLLGLDTGHNT